MRTDPREMAREHTHEEHLRLKLERVLPEDLVEHCETLADMEHMKEVVDAVKRSTPKPRCREKREALLYEEQAEDLLLPVPV